MITFKSMALVCATLLASSAFAQDCASPLPISSEGGPNDHVAGDLCSATNTLPTLGGTPSPGPDIIYSFVAQGANATLTFTQGSEGTWNGQLAGIYLMPACTQATDPTNFGFAGTPMVVNGLTDGQTYYIVVNADSTAPAGTCGTFEVDVTGTLPVGLASFTVE